MRPSTESGRPLPVAVVVRRTATTEKPSLSYRRRAGVFDGRTSSVARCAPRPFGLRQHVRRISAVAMPLPPQIRIDREAVDVQLVEDDPAGAERRRVARRPRGPRRGARRRISSSRSSMSRVHGLVNVAASSSATALRSSLRCRRSPNPTVRAGPQRVTSSMRRGVVAGELRVRPADVDRAQRRAGRPRDAAHPRQSARRPAPASGRLGRRSGQGVTCADRVRVAHRAVADELDRPLDLGFLERASASRRARATSAERSRFVPRHRTAPRTPHLAAHPSRAL